MIDQKVIAGRQPLLREQDRRADPVGAGLPRSLKPPRTRRPKASRPDAAPRRIGCGARSWSGTSSADPSGCAPRDTPRLPPRAHRPTSRPDPRFRPCAGASRSFSIRTSADCARRRRDDPALRRARHHMTMRATRRCREHGQRRGAVLDRFFCEPGMRRDPVRKSLRSSDFGGTAAQRKDASAAASIAASHPSRRGSAPIDVARGAVARPHESSISALPGPVSQAIRSSRHR